MKTIEVKNGQARFSAKFTPDGNTPYLPVNIVFSTKIPDGIYNEDDITFEISDGVRDPDFPVGCLVLHTKKYAKENNINVWM